MKKYLVGGAVRDQLLHLPVKDRDWVVVGCSPEEMIAKDFQPVGRDFPVFLHPISHEEYALARTERKTGFGHNGFTTYADISVTLEQDLYRRDITINAIAVDETGHYIDPYHGRRDIALRKLRHVSPAFREDPLRILRIARFAARFFSLGFDIADETRELMKQMVQDGELQSLTAERVWQETARALCTDNPSIYFQTLHDCQALEIIFPEIHALFSIPTPIEWHNNMDMGTYALKALAVAVTLTPELEIRFATLVNHLNGASTQPAELLPQPNGITIDTSAISALCKRLRIPNAASQLAQLAAQFGDVIENIKSLNASKLVMLMDNIDAWRKPERIEQLALISEANFRGRENLLNNSYFQGDYLRRAFVYACSVNSKEIVAKGFTGPAIREELTRQRIHLITAKLFSLA